MVSVIVHGTYSFIENRFDDTADNYGANVSAWLTELNAVYADYRLKNAYGETIFGDVGRASILGYLFTITVSEDQ